MVGRQRIVARSQRRAAEVGELVGVELDRQAVRARGRKHPVGLLRGEADPLAERIHRVREAGFGDRRQHLLDHEVDIGALPAGIFRGQGVRAEEGGLDIDRQCLAEPPGDAELLELGVGVEPVARLDLDRGDPFVHQIAESRHRRFVERFVVGLPCSPHGRDDPAARLGDLLVARAVEPHLELTSPAAAEDQMGVAVDQPRGDPAPACVMHNFGQGSRVAGQVRGRADPGDAPALDRDGGIADRAIGGAARDHRRQIGAGPEPVPFAPARLPARHGVSSASSTEDSMAGAFHLPAICSRLRRKTAQGAAMSGSTRRDNTREIHAPTGAALNALSWQTEAPLRMLMNNLDPAVAEKPEELTVYGGIGRAARNWECFDTIVAVLKRLRDDQTLLVQSGKPVGVFETHADAPRVLIANSNLVARWSDWDHFNELDRAGLMMYGQMTAGSWIYIGSQGIVQGTYETFVEAGRQHYGGTLRGRWILTGGLGGMGGAQPLAATMAGASLLAVECRASHIERRIEGGYLDRMSTDLDEALAIVRAACDRKEAVSVGLLGNAAEVFPALVERGVRPDLVTDQTAAHDPANGYLPAGWSLHEWRSAARAIPRGWGRRRERAWRSRCARCSPSGPRASRRSITATISVPGRKRRGSRTPSTSRVSCRPISGPCSAAARGRSAGPRCPAIQRTSTGPTRRSASCSPTTRI